MLITTDRFKVINQVATDLNKGTAVRYEPPYKLSMVDSLEIAAKVT